MELCVLCCPAGFDGVESDPLGGTFGLQPADYDWAAGVIRQSAEVLCAGRVVSVLEGGYDTSSDDNGLAKSVVAHVRGLSNSPPIVYA
jgi:acetoin utilization deacetylase AcuC-like enzyme